jgi:transposase InsO family protein
MDLFDFQGVNYLVTVDYYSKWVTIDKMNSTRAINIITVVDWHFANYGIPQTLFSDNGPQFASAEVQEYTTKLGIHQITSSPGFPSSNGQAERSIERRRKLWGKCLLTVAL